MNGKHASGRLTVEPPALPGLATLLVGALPAIIARVADEDDARRLAAAWNACEGSATDRVEELAEIGGIPALIVYSDEVRIERDDARKALAVAISMLMTKGLTLPEDLVEPVHDIMRKLDGPRNQQRALELFATGLGQKGG